MMLFTTPTQFAALALALFAGWLFGLASHPGGRKWKTRYATERDAHAGYRRDTDTRVAEANRRIAELEAENSRLAKAQPVAAPVVTTTDGAVAERPTLTDRLTGRQPVAARAARPAFAPRDANRGWFDWR
ncbi:hypothetical protein ACU5AX_06435 [Sphingomonas sp. XXL09]|uniref:hypothetical protein n=1 Tax=Sphingomonas sp. XXL09 TaxID=3457787 RepID=UPI00406BBD0C